MKTVKVNSALPYCVHIGDGLLEQIGEFTGHLKPSCKIAVISDATVFSIYGKIVVDSFEKCGYTTCSYAFASGEASKNATIYLQILEFVARNHITRSDLVVALGGGVVGDIAGFAAATYLRGIDYIQVPTTLLAMVDSSVGGKTAIDLASGKNLVGAFHQPIMVICDTNTLLSLPDRIFRDGCAEIIKYGVLYDSQLFSHLFEYGANFDMEYVISRCVSLKASVIEEDERDHAARQMLNLGHSFGHAIEQASNYTVTHGQAVGIGLNMAARSAYSLGLCNQEIVRKIEYVTQLFTLPTRTEIPAEIISKAMLTDKKRSGDMLKLILPCDIGKCMQYIVPVSELEDIVRAGIK